MCFHLNLTCLFLFVKRTKWYKLKSQRLSLIPQPKAYTPPSSSLSSSVSESFTPRQAKPEKKVVASELGENMIHFSFVLFKRRKINVLKNLTSSCFCVKGIRDQNLSYDHLILDIKGRI